MAKQHFYSRVPARISMFNRADGFDTFAHSEGLDREFIEKELSAVYENKLAKKDMEAVRQGQMPKVYSQHCLRSGCLVQSCIQYLPKDYTGERSAYLCNTLVLTEQERELLSSRGNAPLNPEMFETDVSKFDFLSQQAEAASSYPEKTYIPCAAADPAALPSKYDPETLKSFILALLTVLCAKGKGIYFKLSQPDEEVSAEALELIGSVMQVIPYHLRKTVSFATYVTEPGQYAQVKMKAVSADCPEIPPAKGIFLDFATGLVTGMPGSEVVAKAPVNFFYSLLEDKAVRDEFLLFVHKAVQTLPSLEKLNMKTLSDLVFLFGGASGLYPQETILPSDEKVYELLCIYEKYREALGEEHRKNVYRCIERYPQHHAAIPKNVFSKLSRLYPGEVHSAKRMAMDAVLELIHTDIMRDKLFTFVKNNYDGEDADIRAAINANLCRVFYGGFLQPQILTFFSEHFSQEPEETQNAIFEKLMLTIRTDSVQPKILAFLEQNYESLSEGQKQLFYNTFYEMLPECDALAQQLIFLVNGKVEKESAQRKETLAEGLKRLLENDAEKQEHRLMPMLCKAPGFCCDTVIRLVFGPWNSREIFGEYLGQLAQKTVVEKTEELFHILDLTISMGEAAQRKLIAEFEGLFSVNLENTNLYHWLDADRIAGEHVQEGKGSFVYLFRMKVVQPAVTHRLAEVFDTRLRKDGLACIQQYVKTNEAVEKSQQYGPIGSFLRLQAAAEQQDTKTVFFCLQSLPRDETLRRDMASYIRGCLLNQRELPLEQIALYSMSVAYLTTGGLLSDGVYETCKEFCVGIQYQLQGAKVNAAKALKDGACAAAELLLGYWITAAGVSQEFGENFQEGLDGFLRAFVMDYGKGGNKWITAQLSRAPAQLMSKVRQSLVGIKPRTGSFLSKLLGKNRKFRRIGGRYLHFFLIKRYNRNRNLNRRQCNESERFLEGNRR